MMDLIDEIDLTPVYYDLHGVGNLDIKAELRVTGIVCIYQGRDVITVPKEHIGYLLDALMALFVTRDEHELAEAVRGPQ